MSAELECQGEAVAIRPSQGRLLTFIAIVLSRFVNNRLWLQAAARRLLRS
jgi:hypothetical protein